MAAMPPTPEALIAHGDFLRGLARSLIGDEHRAEDVVQQAYLRALRKPPLGAGVRAWLAAVVRRLSLNDARGQARLARREAAVARLPDVPSTEEIVQREALRQRVVLAVLGLPEPYRSTVVLRHFESLTPAEVAGRLSVTPSTVRSRLQRAHEMLRARLDEAHGGDRATWAVLLAPLARPHAWGSLLPVSTTVLLMKKTALGLIALASTAAVAWFVFDGLSAPPQPDSTSSLEASQTATAADEAGTTAERRTLDASVNRETRPGSGSPGMSPSYTAALATFRGRVVNKDAVPVPGCGVEMFRVAFDSLLHSEDPTGRMATPRLRVGRATTGADGGFELAGIRPGGLFLMRAGLGTDSPTTKIVPQAPAPGETVDLGDVVLEALGSITGIAADPAGMGLPDAEVLAIDVPPAFLGMIPVYAFDPRGAILLREGQGPISVIELPSWVGELIDSLPIPRTRTDAQGRFVLVGVPPGTTSLAVVAPGLQPLLHSGVRVTEGETQDLGTLRLGEGERLGGVVVDAAGEAIAGAEVLAAPHNALAAFDFSGAPLRADAEGRFAATGFPPGRVRLAARRGPGHRWVVSEPRAVDEDMEFQLPPLHTLTVRLRSNDRLAFLSPRGSLLPGHGAGLPEMATFGLSLPLEMGERVEYDRGRLQFRDLEPGWYTLRILDPAHAVAVLEVEIEGDTERELSLDARVPLSVRVVDGTGAPVAGATVFAQLAPTPQWASSMPIPCGLTDESGRIDLGSIPGPEVEVIASHPAFGQVRATVSRSETGNTLTFREIGTLEGVVHRNGRLVDGSRWSVLLQAPSMSSLPSFPRITRPDNSGRFRFPALQPGRYRVQAVDSLDMLLTPGVAVELGGFSWMPGSRVADVEVRGGRAEQARLDVAESQPTEEPGARVTGTVMIDAAPGRDLLLVAEFEDGREPVVVRVDGDGRFDLGHLSAGTRFVYCFDVVQRSFADNQPHTMWSGHVEVTAGADRELVIDVHTGTLAGQVFDADGQAVAEVWVEAQGVLATGGRGEDDPARSRYVVQTDSEGLFEIAGVAPGTWQVTCRSPGETAVTGGVRDIVVQPGQRRADVRLRLDR